MALKFEMGVGGSLHPALGMLERVAGGGSVVDSKVLMEDTNNPDPPGGEVNLYQIVG